MTLEQKVELKKGLKDVYFDRTNISDVDPSGKLIYRGYNIHDLAPNSSFEEVCYLLLKGSLPTKAQLAEFESQIRSSRQVPSEVLQVIRITKSAYPMDVLRTAVSAMALSDKDVNNMSPEAVYQKSVRITAAVPTIVAAHDRIRRGLEPLSPRNDLGHAANFLYMLTGAVQDPQDARLIDKDFLLHAEHGVNASTFAGRVAASTSSDYYAAITAAIATLKGPKHGGAAEAVMQMAEEIGSEENAESYVENVLASGGRVMGFGHAVYKDVDPRSVHLRADAEALGTRKGNPKWFRIIAALTETKAMKRRARLGINPNVDLWSGSVYALMGIPKDLYVPIFAIGRMPGWSAHVIEQYEDKNILRPRLLYAGQMDLAYVPIEKRG
ncbi:MAG: citrate (Si)-synthase [SAR202 cluster bacterium]|nr:citrate (Si)-synthase [SAR202 cluster bacterium]